MPIYLSSPKMSVAMMLLRADIIIEFDGGEDRKFQLRAVQVPQFRSAVFIYMCVCVCASCHSFGEGHIGSHIT